MSQATQSALILLGTCLSFHSLKAQTGSLDPSFDPGEGTDAKVNCIAIQSDGKILVAGDFQNYGEDQCAYLVRLNADGTVDPGFAIDSGADGDITAMIIQPDGRILVGGEFYYYQGVPSPELARLNTDGTLDTTFTSHNLNGGPNGFALQPDGKILVVGLFDQYQGVPVDGIVRLMPDGTLDPGFDPGAGANAMPVNSAAVQTDGRIVVVGSFDHFGNAPREKIARLNSNGSVDAGFQPGEGFAFGGPKQVVVLPDNKILACGLYVTYDGVSRRGIARLASNGDLDTSFDPGGGFVGAGGIWTVRAMQLQPDGKIIVAGNWDSYDGVPFTSICRLLPNGDIDMDFNPGTSVAPIEDPYDRGIHAMAIQSDGRIVIGGAFTGYDGTPRNNLARVNNDANAVPVIDAVSTLTAAPNPTTGKVTCTTGAPGILQVRNALGSVVLQEIINTDPITVDLNAQPNGVYFLTVRSAGQFVSTKLVKQ